MDFLSSTQDIHTPEQPHWGFAANTENSGKRGHLLGQFRQGILATVFFISSNSLLVSHWNRIYRGTKRCSSPNPSLKQLHKFSSFLLSPIPTRRWCNISELHSLLTCHPDKWFFQEGNPHNTSLLQWIRETQNKAVSPQLHLHNLGKYLLLNHFCSCSCLFSQSRIWTLAFERDANEFPQD